MGVGVRVGRGGDQDDGGKKHRVRSHRDEGLELEEYESESDSGGERDEESESECGGDRDDRGKGFGLNELFDESVKEEESEIGDNGDLGVRASVDVDRFLEDHREMMEEMEEAGIDLDAMVDLDALLEKYGG